MTNHNGLVTSHFFAYCSLLSVSCTSIGRFANHPYHRTQKFSCLYGATSVHCSLTSAHCSLTTVSCTSIGRFANRPYSRAQNPHANMGQPLFTTHCSLTSVHCSLTSVHYSFTGIIPVILWAFRWVNRLSKSIPIPLVMEPCRLSIYSKGCSVNTQSVLACQKSSEVLSTLPS